MGLSDEEAPVTGSGTFSESQASGHDRGKRVRDYMPPPLDPEHDPDGMTIQALDDIMQGIFDTDDGSSIPRARSAVMGRLATFCAASA